MNKYFVKWMLVIAVLAGHSMVGFTQEVPIPGYDSSREIEPGLYRVMNNNLVGVVTADGKVLIPCEFTQIWNLDKEGYFKVLKERKVGLYSKSGQIIIPPEYDQVWGFKENQARVLKNGKIGYYRPDGSILVPAIYQQIWSFEDGKARVLKDGKIGFINDRGKEIVPCVYQQIWEFEEGKARVLREGLLGVIDEEGEEIIPPQFSQIWEFREGRAKALLDGKLVWINEQGQVLENVAEQDAEFQEDEYEPIDDSPVSDTTVVRIWKDRVEIISSDEESHIRIGREERPVDRKRYRSRKRRFKGHWAGVNLGYNNFVTANGSFTYPDEYHFMELNAGKSVGIAINPWQQSIKLQQRGNIGLVTGLGIEWNNYRFDSQNVLVRDVNGNTSYVVADEPIKKNKLTTCYLNVPLLLEFQIPTGKQRYPLYVSGGVIGGVRLGSYSKVVYSGEGGKGTQRTHDHFNLHQWRYGTTFRMGYRAINLFADYYMTPIFEKNKGPELYPVTAGVSFCFG
jgi:hypothetical protein